MAAGLRDGGWEGDIALVGAEAERPYERPHLSKGYLAGSVPREKLWLRPAAQYLELRVDLILGTKVVDLGLDRREVVFEGGRTMRWDRLCIATGSTPRVPAHLGEGLLLRELREAGPLRSVIDSGAAIQIIGAGFIGCEVGAVAAMKGREVHIYEQLEQPLVRVLGPELGAYFAQVHRAHGVDLHLSAKSPVLEQPFLVAAGSVPQTFEVGLAGLKHERGIVVDELGRTSHEDVYAAGDVARFYHPLFETHVRVEHFQTSQRQGFAAGRAMAGAGEPYAEVPWFWSDQYDLNLQYAGAGLPWDDIAVRGALGEPPFTVFYLQAGRVVGAAGVNDHHTIARTRRVMEARAGVTRLQLEDPNFDLRRALA